MLCGTFCLKVWIKFSNHARTKNRQPLLTMESIVYQGVMVIGGLWWFVEQRSCWIYCDYLYSSIKKKIKSFYRITFWLTSEDTELSTSRAICISDLGVGWVCSVLNFWESRNSPSPVKTKKDIFFLVEDTWLSIYTVNLMISWCIHFPLNRISCRLESTCN